MLQQTTVAAVVPLFLRWMERFPEIEALASAEPDDVMAAWQGLGYYRRARSLHRAAKIIVQNGWPTDMEDWCRLPGVGAYTAGAVCSISYKMRVPAVDANVERVFARVTATERTDKSKATQWATELAQCDQPGDLNQALMDLGATVCRAKSWDCGNCPINRSCLAFKQARQAALPSPIKKQATVEMRQHAEIAHKDGRFGVRKFGSEEWWTGLYGFPRSCSPPNGSPICILKHTVTRHRIQLHVHLVRRPKVEVEWRTFEELRGTPMPAPDRKALEHAVQAIGSKPSGTARLPSSAKK